VSRISDFTITPGSEGIAYRYDQSFRIYSEARQKLLYEQGVGGEVGEIGQYLMIY